MLLPPAGRLLVGVANAEHRHFVKGPAEHLHPEWQAVAAKAVAEFQRRLARDV